MNEHIAVTRFHDRHTAGRSLAGLLADPATADIPADSLVVGMTSGGVPVAQEVSRRLHLPLDVVVVQRLHLPDQPWQTLGSLAEHRRRALLPGIFEQLLVSPNAVERTIRRQDIALRRRAQRLRQGNPPLPCRGRTVLLVDDGLDQGTNALAACAAALRVRGAPRIVLAVPVASPATIVSIGTAVDQVVSLYSPQDFRSVGYWYADFPPAEDGEITAALHRGRRPDPQTGQAGC